MSKFGTTAVSGEEGLCLSAIQAQIKFLSGDILTIVDASYSDVTQRDAVKSLVKSTVSRSLDYVRDLVTGRGAAECNSPTAQAKS